MPTKRSLPKDAHTARQQRDANTVFGQTMARLREQRSMSQQDLANEAGLSRSFVHSVEIGKRFLSAEAKQRVFGALETRLHIESESFDAYWRSPAGLSRPDPPGVRLQRQGNFEGVLNELLAARHLSMEGLRDRAALSRDDVLKRWMSPADNGPGLRYSWLIVSALEEIRPLSMIERNRFWAARGLAPLLVRLEFGTSLADLSGEVDRRAVPRGDASVVLGGDLHQALLRRCIPVQRPVAVRPGADHPEDNSRIHPDNLEAARNLMSFFDHTKLIERDDLGNSIDEPSAWSLGSSTSTSEIREILGRVEGDEIVSTDETPIKMKWAFGRIEERASRFIAGELTNRRLTALYDISTGRPISICIPQSDSNCDLISDYLVITRLPNLFGKEVDLSRSDYLNIAGLTGVGTKAGAAALSRVGDLRELAHFVDNDGPYQALFEVRGIVNDPEARRSYSDPASVILMDVQRLDIDETRVMRWMEREGARSS